MALPSSLISYMVAERCGSAAAESGSDGGADAVGSRLQPIVRQGAHAWTVLAFVPPELPHTRYGAYAVRSSRKGLKRGVGRVEVLRGYHALGERRVTYLQHGDVIKGLLLLHAVEGHLCKVHGHLCESRSPEEPWQARPYVWVGTATPHRLAHPSDIALERRVGRKAERR